MGSFIAAHKSPKLLSSKSIQIWRMVQVLVWLVGFAIFFCLLFYPAIGLIAFWNILIPVAPALLVVATGLWRNICPLATTSLFPRHVNISKKRVMPIALQGKLQLAAIIALFVIVPLRHLLFNTNGMATAILLAFTAVTSVTMGLVYDWKSGWCNSLCPVSPVERLYGGNTLFTLHNAHCESCAKCTVPCPDSTPNATPLISRKTICSQLCGLITVGGLPGFIFGWFFIPDYPGNIRFYQVFEAYKMPALGFCISLTVYLLLKPYFSGKKERFLTSCFAAASVSFYYIFRIPALFGFGQFKTDVFLFNLTDIMPQWGMAIIVVCTTMFFFWWLVFRDINRKSWMIRPEYTQRHSAKKQPSPLTASKI